MPGFPGPAVFVRGFPDIRLAGSPKAIRPGARQTTAAAPAIREAGRAQGGIITEPMGGGAGEGGSSGLLPPILGGEPEGLPLGSPPEARLR